MSFWSHGLVTPATRRSTRRWVTPIIDFKPSLDVACIRHFGVVCRYARGGAREPSVWKSDSRACVVREKAGGISPGLAEVSEMALPASQR